MSEYIEKNKIINLLEYNDKVYHYADRDKENIVHDTVQTLCRVIIEAEATDVKRGAWVEDDIHIKVCSECQTEAYWDTDYGQQLFKYCPYCGARMGEQEVEEDA